MDRYTKFILTLIAVGIVGINFHLIKGDIISKAYAGGHEVHKIAICDQTGVKCVSVFNPDYNKFNYLVTWPKGSE
jgi:RPA family protein|tara:strand:- start:131 stop:355 length:225 start_codon:yes stop_codon:yes gene_type:complete